MTSIHLKVILLMWNNDFVPAIKSMRMELILMCTEQIWACVPMRTCVREDGAIWRPQKIMIFGIGS